MSDKKFEWTDTLVQEFALKVKITGEKEWVHDQLSDFKASHSIDVKNEKNKPMSKFFGDYPDIDTVKWTPEMIVDFAHYWKHNVADYDKGYVRQGMQSWLAKNQSNPSIDVKPEKITVNGVESWGKTWKGNEEYIVVKTSDKVPEERYESIKLAIESALSPTVKESASIDVGRDGEGWQIECIQLGNKNYWLDKNGFYRSGLVEGEANLEWLLAKGGIIHQVTRKSDNVTFSVGEETDKGKIKAIKISDDGRLYFDCRFGNNVGILVFDTLSKLPPERSKILTDKNGVDIFEGDSFYVVTSDYKISGEQVASESDRGYWKQANVFSTREKAIDYIAKNQKLFSVKDIWEITGKYGLPLVAFENEIQRIAQTKIKL